METFGFHPNEIADMTPEQQIIHIYGSEKETITCGSMMEARQIMALLKGS